MLSWVGRLDYYPVACGSDQDLISEQAMEPFLEMVEELEARVAVRPGFFNELIREDDWSFVIKLNAFVETCLTEAICTVLMRDELAEVVSRLDTANDRTGKLAFAKALGLLDKPQRRFVSELAQLRNRLAHDPRQSTFSFKVHLDAMSEESRYQWCASLSLHDLFADQYEADEIPLITWVHDVPKVGIAWAASLLLSDLRVKTAEGDLARQVMEVGRGFMRAVAPHPDAEVWAAGPARKGSTAR